MTPTPFERSESHRPRLPVQLLTGASTPVIMAVAPVPALPAAVPVVVPVVAAPMVALALVAITVVVAVAAIAECEDFRDVHACPLSLPENSLAGNAPHKSYASRH